jgi:NADH:ubiquinone oxidoreductase subunit K
MVLDYTKEFSGLGFTMYNCSNSFHSEPIFIAPDIIQEKLPIILCLDFSFMLFIIGLIGIIWNRRNFIIMLICLELVYFSISLNFLFFSIYGGTNSGQIYAMLIIATVAAETAIGLSLLVILYRLGRPITYKSLKQFRG